MKHKKASMSKGGVLNQFKATLSLACFFVMLFFLSGQQLVYAASQISGDVRITNTAAASYDLPNQTKKIKSNTVEATATSNLPPIKVEKTVSTPFLYRGRLGIFDLTYTIKLTNTSNSPVAFVHLADNLNCTYRMYEGGAGLVKSWELLPQTLKVVDGPLVINSRYTGNAPCSSDKVDAFDTTASVQMVDGKVTLLPGASSTITYKIRLSLIDNLPNPTITFTNTAFAAILKSADSTSAIVASVPAIAPVQLDLVPPIKVSKKVSEPLRVQGLRSVFDMVYTITATNTSNTPATYVHLADNLNCTYRMYDNAKPIKKWEIIKSPQIIDGPLIANPQYTGDAPCESDNVIEFDSTANVQLVNGKITLPPHSSSTLTYSVRIAMSPELTVAQRKFLNTVYSVVLAREDDFSAISAAASAATPIYPVDPSGVVYNSVTREAVVGAISTLTRVSCPAGSPIKTGDPITPAQIFTVPGTTDTHIYNGTTSIKQLTDANGFYFYFFQQQDDCTYHLTVEPPVGAGLTFPSKLIPVTSGIAPVGFVQPQATPPAIGQDTTHYFDFILSLKGDVFNNHIPLDPKSAPGTIFLEKKSNKTVVELGDALFYTINATNNTGTDLTTAQIQDVLPRGFSLVSGSARLGDKTLPNPVGAPGASLLFNLPDLTWKNGDKLTLTYLVQVGVGAALDKSSINKAQAFSGDFTSNQSAWSVMVTGGVFSDEAYLIGKVYLENCKADKVQNKEGEVKQPAQQIAEEKPSCPFLVQGIDKVLGWFGASENLCASIETKVENKQKNTDHEVGIPGVRLLMEDGTSVVTDIEGKYSLYGLSPITHVLKLDATTLPLGSRLIVLSNRNSGAGDSRFVDLKKGELHKADFAVNSCDADSVVQEVNNRRKALQSHPISEGEALIQQKLNPTYIDTPVTDARSRPASGALTATGMQSSGNTGNSATSNTGSSSASSSVSTDNTAFQGVLPSETNQSLAQQRLNESFPTARPSVIPLEELVKNLDNKTGFIDLKEGDTLPTDVTNIRVKGLLDATLQLRVNGEIEPLRRVGKKSKISDKKLEAWEYIGVKLNPGTNKIVLEVIDSFGNVRETQAINLIAPGKAGSIEIQAPKTALANFKTPVKIKIRLVDDNGIPVTLRTQLTLESDYGRWENKDLNPTEPGTQAFMENGVAEFNLIPPGEAKDAVVRVTANTLQREVKISFLPELRPLIGAGIVEGVLDFSRSGKVNVNAPSAFDAFERELRNLSVSGNSLKATGRAAFYFKGTIKGEYLLTTAYDSDKDTKQRLFRDIQPEKFYPIYGDSSLKSFDAQSTQRFYLRVDQQKSYLLYGDFTTNDNNEARKLSQYSRSVTGVKTHYENGDFSATAFASRDSLSQGIIEIPANGTSGPYKLNTNGSPLYENSEKIEILVRDKNQPSVILETISLSRFSDYAIDPLLGEIFFKGPQASIDANLNPRSIRVTYEVQRGGKQFWMAGADARLKIADFLELGASYARDENPQKKSQVMGATATIKVDDKTTLIGEVARTSTGKDTTGLTSNSATGYLNQNLAGLSGEGWAERVLLRHSSDDFKLNVQFTHASKAFNNPTGGFSSGRTEATLNTSYKIMNGTNLNGQAIYSKDNNTGGMRAGFLASIEHAFTDMIKGELGIRAAHETAAAAQPTSVDTTPNDLLAIRAKLSSKLPWIEGADIYTEAEQNVLNSKQRMFAVGAGYLLNAQTRLYGRYQFISSISNSSYGLNSSQQNNTAVLGVESAYMPGGRLFSEYRIRDAINGRESQAAVGLRQTWDVAEGLKLGGSFEMTHAFAGQAGSESKAVTALAEYTADPRYKLTGSAEARFASGGNSYANTLGLAYKINDDWSLLTRHSLTLQESKSSQSKLWRTRQQIGVAWRQVDDNRWNALARYEHRLECQVGGTDPYNEESHIISTHVNYQPHRDVITSGRYAVKLSEQTRNNVTSNFMGHLLYGRVTWDFLPNWDASLQSGMMVDRHALQYAVGAEFGHQVMDNLWVSAGYNFRGFDGGDLKGTDYTSEGFYVRMRFKFDEGLFN